VVVEDQATQVLGVILVEEEGEALTTKLVEYQHLEEMVVLALTELTALTDQPPLVVVVLQKTQQQAALAVVAKFAFGQLGDDYAKS
jgi:hypothetical protein